MQSLYIIQKRGANVSDRFIRKSAYLGILFVISRNISFKSNLPVMAMTNKSFNFMIQMIFNVCLLWMIGKNCDVFDTYGTFKTA